jgi:hypothetical protein
MSESQHVYFVIPLVVFSLFSEVFCTFMLLDCGTHQTRSKHLIYIRGSL